MAPHVDVILSSYGLFTPTSDHIGMMAELQNDIHMWCQRLAIKLVKHPKIPQEPRGGFMRISRSESNGVKSPMRRLKESQIISLLDTEVPPSSFNQLHCVIPRNLHRPAMIRHDMMCDCWTFSHKDEATCKLTHAGLQLVAQNWL